MRVTVQMLTEGTMEFGLTMAEKAALGKFLIIVGAVFIAPPVLILLCRFFEIQRQRKMDHQEDAEAFLVPSANGNQQVMEDERMQL